MFIGSVTDVGGATMSLLFAVPPDDRFTVMSVALDADAVIRKVAGVPSDTTAFVDWILSTGTASGVTVASSPRNAVSTPWWVTPLVAAVVCAPPGPMMRPADVSLPSVYPEPCASETVTDCDATGVAPG